MRRAKYPIVAIITVLLLTVVVWPAAAQTSSPITAEVDRTTLTTDDRLTLVVTIDATINDAGQLILPDLDGFQMLGTSRGSQMSIINGQISSQTYYQITLQPTRPGDLVIGEVAVAAGGGTYTSDPITVRVSQGNGMPSAPSQPSSALPSLPGFPSLGNFGSLGNLGSLLQQLQPPAASTKPTVPVDPSPAPVELAGQDLYLEALVDNQAPYQGQQVLYKVRFYQAVQGLGPVDYRPPSFTGFWSEQLPEQGEYAIQAAGRNYRVTELTSVLFPTVVGETTIDPATLAVPGDLFSRGANLASQPITLNVQPLPDTAPAGFQGAVGRFDIESSADKSESRVNDTVNWRIVLSGRGNVENLPDPAWNESQAWRAFDTQATVDSRFENGALAGSRIYDRVLVPTEAGELTLPAVTYSYFDPELGEYVTIESQALSIYVMPDGSAAPLPARNAGATAPPPTGAVADYRPMKEAPASWTTGSPWLTDKAGFWLMWAIPLAALAVHVGWRRRQNSRLSNLYTRRSKQAAGKARQALQQARKGPAGDLYHVCGQVLTTYLAQKLDRSLTGMTQNGIAELLDEQGVDSELSGRVERCLMVSEMGRYAPADLYKAGDELSIETERLIAELDKVL